MRPVRSLAVSLLLAGLLLALAAAPAVAQSQQVPGLTCGKKNNPTPVYVVTHAPQLQVVVDPATGQMALRLTLTCGPDGPVIGNPVVPFTYTVDTTLDALILTFTVPGASEPSTVFLAATDTATADQLDRYARELERAQRQGNTAEEARLLNELLALLTA